MSEEWIQKAEENIEQWGNQEPAILLLAIMEEVAETADEMIKTGDAGIGTDNLHSNRVIMRLQEIRNQGYQCRDYLEKFHEIDGKPRPDDEVPRIFNDVDSERVLDEVNDIAPLVYQLRWALEEDDG